MNILIKSTAIIAVQPQFCGAGFHVAVCSASTKFRGPNPKGRHHWLSVHLFLICPVDRFKVVVYLQSLGVVSSLCDALLKDNWERVADKIVNIGIRVVRGLVDPRVGLVWVGLGREWVEICVFNGLGWVVGLKWQMCE